MDVGASPVAQMVNSLPAMCNAEDLSSTPGSRRSPGEENGYPFHKYRCMTGPGRNIVETMEIIFIFHFYKNS